MLSFQTKRYRCSALEENAFLPPLPCLREKQQAKSTITDYEGLFIDYGYRATAYPYPEQNLYSEECERDVSIAVLENEFLYAAFLPDFGGRLWKLYDKKRQRDVLYTNDVIRFRNLSIRNAWFSGGVEWNCGIIGHSPFTCSRMYCARVSGADGQEVLRFYEFERVRGIYYQIDFWLEENRLMAAVRIENPNYEVVPMYWWSNMATPEYEGGRVAVPADSAYNNSDGMGIKKSHIPFDSGIDVSFPQNIPDTIDYFYDIPAQANKFIANVDGNGYGLLEISSNRLKGRKLFSWGHRRGSAHWQRMLTDQAGDYVEIQAGLGKTQYECLPMPPRTSWSFLECYTLADIGADAVQGSYAELVGAVNRQVESLCASALLDSRLQEVKQAISLQKGELVRAGSGFGHLDGLLTGNTPAHLEFCSDADSAPWEQLLETGSFPAHIPSFACGRAMEALLERHREHTLDWHIPYQLALLAFDRGDLARAQSLCRESFVLDNNVWNNHLYAFLLYQQGDGRFSHFALKCLAAAGGSYCACESVLRLLLCGERYADLIAHFDAVEEALQSHPRLRMYLSMAYLKTGDADSAEQILLENGGLKLFDFREGDRFLDNLYRGIRHIKYGEPESAVAVPPQFDFIVSRQEPAEQ